MTLIHDNEIKETAAKLFIGVFGFVVRKPLIEREIDIVGRIDILVFDDGHRLLEGAKIVTHRLVNQSCSVCEKQDALLGTAFPKAMDNLERGVGFARTGSHHQKHPLIALRYCLNSAIDCYLLIVAGRTSASIPEIVLSDNGFSFRSDASIGFVFGPECLGRGK